MSKIKRLLDDLDLNEAELQQELYLRNDYDYQWGLYKNSEDYVNMINDEISSLAKIYNTSDVTNALDYASESITIEPKDIGKEVYDKLFSEKVIEYLKINND